MCFVQLFPRAHFLIAFPPTAHRTNPIEQEDSVRLLQAAVMAAICSALNPSLSETVRIFKRLRDLEKTRCSCRTGGRSSVH
ncbi:unnamed protein product [Linum trigynum]|uniref:Uncharacterized protein n=1 Tax=Linum trigynum TaxID=586398 RepID=A0AAV2G2J1_9ROSI